MIYCPEKDEIWDELLWIASGEVPLLWINTGEIVLLFLWAIVGDVGWDRTTDEKWFSDDVSGNI